MRSRSTETRKILSETGSRRVARHARIGSRPGNYSSALRATPVNLMRIREVFGVSVRDWPNGRRNSKSALFEKVMATVTKGSASCTVGILVEVFSGVTFVTSNELFWDNPYTRARALRLMQEDVTNVTNVTPGFPPRRILRPAQHCQPSLAIFELGSSKACELDRRGSP